MRRIRSWGQNISRKQISQESYLVGDEVVSKQRVCFLLVEFDGDVPGLVAPHLVKLAGGGRVHAHLHSSAEHNRPVLTSPHHALQVGAGPVRLHTEVTVHRHVGGVLLAGSQGGQREAGGEDEAGLCHG